MPLHGFTAVDLGYQHGNAVSNFVNRIDEPVAPARTSQLFDQIWKDPTKLTDVTESHLRTHRSAFTRRTPRSASTS